MTINTVTVTPGRVKECLLKQFQSPTLSKKSAFLHGSPGIGKSQLIAQIAEEMNYKLFDMRLSTKDSTDLTGLPFLHEESQKTIYYIPEFFPSEEELEEQGYDGGIVFLDELNAAELRLQAASYELCLDRRVGKYKLPENVVVVAAGNLVEDGAIVFDMTSALADRFLHYKVVASARDWLKWAEDNNIHTAVKTFIKTKPDFLTTGFSAMADNDDKIKCTPRSWHTVSDLMYEIGDGEDALLQIMIPGLVGTATAQEFFFVTNELSKLAPMEEYIALANANKKQALIDLLPTEISGLYGLGYSLPSYCETEEDYLGACYIFNVIGGIKDKLARKELMSNGVVSLFNKAFKIGNDGIARKIRRSAAYKEMRETMKQFAEIERYLKDNVES